MRTCSSSTVRPSPPAREQQGFALLLIVIAMLGVMGVLLVTSLASGNNKMSRDATTATALAKAKDALLAYAITGDIAGRPAEFPCPTTVAPTATNYGASATSCATVRIGRLPWKTLGIQELFDSTGEPLWYAVSNRFRPAVTKINSDSQGDLIIYADGGSTVLASQAVAVIFSAGAPLSGQSRASTTALCSTTSTTIAANLCAVNYLESSSGRNNATNAGPYIAGHSSTTFNDQVVYITTDDFMPKIEDRIATILTQTLKKYYDDNHYYPYAASYSAYASPTTLNCANGKYVGRLPQYIEIAPASPETLCTTGLTALAPWPGTDYLPAWFTSNQWYVAIHYAVGKRFAYGGSRSCVTPAPGDCLTVDGDVEVQAVFILPGIATSTQTRPSGTISNYLETSDNLDEWPSASNYTYTSTASTLSTRDRVVKIKNP